MANPKIKYKADTKTEKTISAILAGELASKLVKNKMIEEKISESIAASIEGRNIERFLDRAIDAVLEGVTREVVIKEFRPKLRQIVKKRLIELATDEYLDQFIQKFGVHVSRKESWES